MKPTREGRGGTRPVATSANDRESVPATTQKGAAGDGLEGAGPVRATALVVRFFVELALMLSAAFAVWVALDGWRAEPGWWRLPVAFGAMALAVVAIAVVWGMFLSPKAGRPLSAPAGVLVEALLFVGVGAALAALGIVIPALILVVTWALDRLVLALTAD